MNWLICSCVLFPPSPENLGSVWLKSQVERSRSVPVLLLFGYKGTRTEWLQLGIFSSDPEPFRSKKSTGRSRSVPDYQTQNRAAPFLESGMERLRSTWLLNQTLPGKSV